MRRVALKRKCIYKPVVWLFCAMITLPAFGRASFRTQDTQSTTSDSATKAKKKKKKATADTTSTQASDKSGAGAAAAAAPASTYAATPSTTAFKATKPGSSGTSSGMRTPPPGNGMVWVNTDTKVYHKQGDRWYGKTKNGKYMSEADAVQAGYRPAQTGGQSK